MDKIVRSLADATSKSEALALFDEFIATSSYEVVEKNTDKPWGAYVRFASSEAALFCERYFSDEQCGDSRLEYSPKFLLVAPGKRLSWQYHHRRAERWKFLTDGALYRSKNDEMGKEIEARTGDDISFEKEERHRLCAAKTQWTIVAEIWEHTDANNPSDEDDIVRVSDDFSRT